jgi:hypothetical protein
VDLKDKNRQVSKMQSTFEVHVSYLHRVRHISQSIEISQPLGLTGVSVVWESGPGRGEQSRIKPTGLSELTVRIPLCHGRHAHDVGDPQLTAYLAVVRSAS